MHKTILQGYKKKDSVGWHFSTIGLSYCITFAE